MPLTWDTKNVADYETVCFLTVEEDAPTMGLEKGDRTLNPVTHALIWASLSTGIGNITEENAAEVYARIHMTEALYGALLRRADGTEGITIEDVRLHIGLYTNASFKDESRQSFLKRHGGGFLDDGKLAYKRKQTEAVA